MLLVTTIGMLLAWWEYHKEVLDFLQTCETTSVGGGSNNNNHDGVSTSATRANNNNNYASKNGRIVGSQREKIE